MEIEFDSLKSKANQQKHGIEIPARTLDEPRWLVIGQINHRHWSAVITLRGQLIRLISVRRSLPEEVQLYEQF